MTSLRWLPGRSIGGHFLASGDARRRARQTARVLNGFDDRLLADIGLRRELIDAAARAASGR